MTNYTKSTNFASKDALASGNALKIVKGTEIDTEFNNIATAVATKADTSSPAFIGTPTAPTAALGTNTTQLATTAFVIQSLYPVGSIYINASVSTNPATLFGFGTWVAFGTGKVLVGIDSSDATMDALEETGGSKDSVVVSHTHTFTGSALAGHSHSYNDTGAYAGGAGSGTAVVQGLGNNRDTSSVSAGTPSGTNSTTGVSGTNANMQPYIVVAMWKRTA